MNAFFRLVCSDIFRIYGKVGWLLFLKEIFFGEAFKCLFWHRASQFFKGRYLFPFFVFSRLMVRRVRYKYGVSIPAGVRIGKGFYIGHFGGVVIHRDVVIGDNCNISQGVTIGIANRGRLKGVPSIGNRVFIGPGAVVVGGGLVGDEAMIGANSVVNFDVPPRAVVVGNPAVVISTAYGSDGYINNLS